MESSTMRRFISLALVFALPGTVQLAVAASPDWSTVKSIPSGTKIRVKLKDSATLIGTIQSSSDDGIVLGLGKNSHRTLHRTDVSQVLLRDRWRSRWRHALIGLGIGFGLGLAASTRKSGNPDTQDLDRILGFTFVPGLGFLVGFLIPRNKVIYRATPVPPASELGHPATLSAPINSPPDS